jgi:cytochrome c
MRAGSAHVLAAVSLLAGLGFAGRALAQDAGEEQFKKACATCHAADAAAPPRQGPNLWGVYGRPSGQMSGFKYSGALAAAQLTWDEATLDRWITNPQALVPGAVMAYRQRDEEKRKLIIGYLKTLGAGSQ